jgi:hypothetical protein
MRAPRITSDSALLDGIPGVSVESLRVGPPVAVCGEGRAVETRPSSSNFSTSHSNLTRLTRQHSFFIIQSLGCSLLQSSDGVTSGTEKSGT